MKLSNEDIEYISLETKLSRDKATLLCEEERDLNLVLDAISSSFSKSKLDTNKLSYSVYVKLVTFKNSKDTRFEIEEKAYVASSVLRYLNQLKSRVKYDILNSKTVDEKFCQYSLVASGLFSQKLKAESLSKKNILKIQNAFIEVGIREVGHHLQEWIQILQQIQSEGWFKASCLDKIMS